MIKNLFSNEPNTLDKLKILKKLAVVNILGINKI